MSMADLGAESAAGEGAAGGSSARTSAECINNPARTTEHNGWSRIERDRTGNVALGSRQKQGFTCLRHPEAAAAAAASKGGRTNGSTRNFAASESPRETMA